MPRRVTTQVTDRKDRVTKFLRDHGEAPTSTLVRELGLSHSQAFYILRLLLREGKVREIKRGKVAYWAVVE
ncbi:MAG: DNA-binding protein [Thermofilaceae archaeon]|nr:DNA-binding protein [Thermofilaceae archaeon]MCX8180620.1 DNA-binding protein [Thermofilaceae archaeon]MDW8003722.1 FaeA/PapI family transcriptional regulator [Thermofilaceae archaeon]